MAGPEPQQAEARLPPQPFLLAIASLTLVAGFLDAFNLTRLSDSFVANQSGNTVLIGIAVAEREWDMAWPPLVAVACFLAGTAAAALLAKGQRAADRTRLLAVEAGLLVLLAIVALAAVGTEADRATSGWLALVVGLSSVAMGVQTSVVRTVQGHSISTTFTSGLIADEGRNIGQIVGGGPAAARRLFPRVRIRLLVLGMYICGAALGALGAMGGTLWLFAAAAMTILVVWAHRAWAADS